MAIGQPAFISSDSDVGLKDIDTRLSRLVQVQMIFDATRLSPQQKELLKSLVEATHLIHEAYLHQTCPEAISIRDSLAQHDDERSRKLSRLVLRNGGPFDKMDQGKNFLGGGARFPGGAFYPRDLTKREFEEYIEANPDQRMSLMSPYTVVRRDGQKLTAVPYHEEFAMWVEPAARSLENARTLASSPSLQTYLAGRADALRTDNYYQSEVDWIDLKDNEIDIIIGPYEVYEDDLMGIKASYEATVGILDREESARLEMYTRHLDDLERYLPHDTRYKRPIEGLVSPMVVVTDICRGGDIATGYQAVAANLPNDPRVHTTKGTKKTFWKNMMDARLQFIIMPLGRELIAADQVEYITPQGLFTFVVLHELSHALGPRYVHGTNGSLSVNQAMKNLYPAIEEGKADFAGLHSLKYFVENKVITSEMMRECYVSYLASTLRTMRFGGGEAHGSAGSCEFNFLRDRQAVYLHPESKKWSVNFETIVDAITELARELLTIQATGDYNRGDGFLRRWGGVPKELENTFGALDYLPVDIEPVYSIKWE